MFDIYIKHLHTYQMAVIGLNYVMDHFTFFIDVKVEHFDYVENKTKEYNIEEYLIAHEQYNRKGEEKPHFHFIVYTDKKNLTNLVKHFVEKFNLRNTSGKRGGIRHYGTNGNKPIHDIEKYRTYCCKDKNVRSNLTEEQLNKYIEKSFQKQDKDVLLYKSYQYIEEHYKPRPENCTLPEYEYQQRQSWDRQAIIDLRHTVLDFCLETNYKITKATIDNFILHYLREKHKEGNSFKYRDLIYHFIFNKIT